MSKVNVLTPEIVSKIAPGEVIEQPASVIKELIENSLDAKSTSIEITLKNAGKTLIQIKDNGTGIEKDDLTRIFLRHATSKIETIDDLYNIASLGFRGEALYSIAAIADIVLQSKTKEEPSGWEIHLRGSKRLNFKPCSMSDHGTEITIQELFFNTPARKKFLKTDTSEMHAIISTLIPYTLNHPSCRFRLVHNDRIMIDLAPCSNIKQRLAESLHIKEEHILTTAHDIPDHNCTVTMHLGDINIKRNRRDLQFIFVNGRPVENKNISFHVNQIYRLILPPGIFPFFVLSIKLPLDNVDVNVHPTKREVKIKDETRLCAVLRRICESALMKGGAMQQALNESTLQENEITQAFSRINRTSTLDGDLSSTKTFEPRESSSYAEDYAFPRNANAGYQKDQANFYIPEENLFEKSKQSLHEKFKNARYIGSFINKYILFESGNSLLLVDQHAAQERIMYEKYIQQMQNGNVEIQDLLTPVTIQLTTQEMLLWEETKNKLEEIGLSTSQFGQDSIAVHTQPVLLKDIERSVRQLLSGDTITTCDHDTIARRACRSSIMTGDRMSKEQAEYQRDQLLDCLDPLTCPHGRPTVIEMPENFLDKQFLRK